MYVYFLFFLLVNAGLLILFTLLRSYIQDCMACRTTPETRSKKPSLSKYAQTPCPKMGNQGLIIHAYNLYISKTPSPTLPSMNHILLSKKLQKNNQENYSRDTLGSASPTPGLSCCASRASSRIPSCSSISILSPL